MLTAKLETLTIFSYDAAEINKAFEGQEETLEPARKTIAKAWGVRWLKNDRLMVSNKKIADFRAAIEDAAGSCCDDENDLLMACLAGENLKPT